MRIVIGASALRHGITRAEIRTTIEYPRFSYRVQSRISAEAQTYVLIGSVGREAWIEVIAELTDTAWLVFHAMLLRPQTAAQVADISGGTVNLDSVATQRPPEGDHQ